MLASRVASPPYQRNGAARAFLRERPHTHAAPCACLNLHGRCWQERDADTTRDHLHKCRQARMVDFAMGHSIKLRAYRLNLITQAMAFFKQKNRYLLKHG